MNITIREICHHLSCDAAVADSPILQCYLHSNHNETYVKVKIFSEFTQWQKSPSITVAVLVMCAINSVLNGLSEQ